MDYLVINGPSKLKGTVRISSSKNASLPIMAAVLLSPQEICIKNLPRLADVKTMKKILKNLGVSITENSDSSETIFKADRILSQEATYEWVKTMRASIVVLGPILSRFGYAKVSLPGGCAIGARPIDIHLDGLKKMGALIELKEGYVEARSPEGGLVGANIILPFPSVGATENLMMAAVFARGKTVIHNAAREPEVEDLGNFLKTMGVEITGAGNSEIIIDGIGDISKLKTFKYEVISDRIEAATYLMAAIMTNSSIKIENIISSHLEAVLDDLRKMGGNFKSYPEKKLIEVFPRGDLSGINLDTAPYPGFPTDVQAQILTMATLAKTPSVITEHIFENRFMHVPELNRMGATIVLKGGHAFVPGNAKLTRAPVMCTDLRASAALVLAALVVKGETRITRIYHLDRGYEDLETKLQNLGVKIERRKQNEGDVE